MLDDIVCLLVFLSWIYGFFVGIGVSTSNTIELNLSWSSIEDVEGLDMLRVPWLCVIVHSRE